MEYVKEIFAQYDRQCIRIYQAYNPTIAKEAIALQTFGENKHEKPACRKTISRQR